MGQFGGLETDIVAWYTLGKNPSVNIDNIYLYFTIWGRGFLFGIQNTKLVRIALGLTKYTPYIHNCR